MIRFCSLCLALSWLTLLMGPLVFIRGCLDISVFELRMAPNLLSPWSCDLVDLPESEKLTLSLCCCGDRPSAWKAIYFECLTSGKHFLEQVLVSCAR